MVTYTTTYNLKKPTVADDEDVWGGYLNDSMDLIDDVLDGTTPVTGIDINSGTIGGVTIDGNLSFGDNTQAIFGADSDFIIQWNETGSTFNIISNTSKNVNITTGGTASIGSSGAQAQFNGAVTTISGNTSISLSGTTISTTTGTGGVTLDYDGSDKIATSSTGVSVTGNITVSGTVDGVDIATRDGVLTTTTTTANAALPKAGGTMTGAITFASGQTFDGRDVSADGSKLDGIESGATADQTKSDIDALGINAATLDSLDSTQFLRSDASDTTSGVLTATDGMISEYIDLGTQGNRTIQGLATRATIGSSGGYGELHLQHYGGDLHTVHGGGTLYANGNTVWHAGNDGSGSGLDADLLDGYHLSTTRNSANTVPVRDSNGYLQLGWINTTSGSTTSTIDKIYASYDDYVRYVTPATLISQLGLHVNSLNNDMTANSAYADNWFRSYYATGWYNQTYGGGIYMTDSTWVRIYASKQFLVDNKARADSWQELYTAKSGTSVTIDADTSGAFSLSMSGNTTFTFSAVDSGISVGFVLQLTGNGSTVTWPTSVDWAGGTAPDAPASGETDIYVFWTRDGGTTWYGVQSIDAAA